MSLIDTVKCDGCGKTVTDGENKGWIRINANEDYSIDLVQGKDKFSMLASKTVDFCRIDCLCKWVKEKIGKAKKA